MKLQFLVLDLVIIFCTVFAEECPPGKFQCGNGDCIPNSNICDDSADCSDGSDENQDCNTCDYWPNFQCADGECISLYKVCDGHDDCSDGSDERDANGNCPSCPAYSFQCPVEGRDECVPKDYICDGHNDCDDSSDEPEGCETRVNAKN